MNRPSESRPRTCALYALLAGLVPLLLLGNALAGDGLLVHQHGESGHHFHVVAESGPRAHEHAGDVHVEGHAQESAHVHAAEASEPAEPSPRPAPTEARDRAPILVAFGGPLHYVSFGSGSLACHAPPLASFVEFGLGIECRPPAPGGAGPPRPPKPAEHRSGIAAVLATSRAIRI